MLPRTIIIMAGGTGGHVYPALAVADYLKSQGHTIKWLGTEAGLEARVVPENGYTLLTVDVAGVRGKGLLKKLLAPFVITRAIFQSFIVFLNHKPSVVLGMGGFASGPGGIAAWLLRIPVCIHEQNAVAGMTNKLLLPFARVIMEAFPLTFDNERTIHLTGNPVRQAILNVMPPDVRYEEKHSEYNLLVIGGSLGARRLNETVPLALAEIENKATLNVRHQSGTQHLDDARQSYFEAKVKAEVTAFIEDMAEAYSWADIVLCRAGAMTIAELSIVGVASILVPFPYAVDDHQTANARFLSDESCAILIQESDFSVKTLSTVLLDLCDSRDRLLAMAEKARSLGKPQATETVANLCMEAAYA